MSRDELFPDTRIQYGGFRSDEVSRSQWRHDLRGNSQRIQERHNEDWKNTLQPAPRTSPPNIPRCCGEKSFKEPYRNRYHMKLRNRAVTLFICNLIADLHWMEAKISRTKTRCHLERPILPCCQLLGCLGCNQSKCETVSPLHWISGADFTTATFDALMSDWIQNYE